MFESFALLGSLIIALVLALQSLARERNLRRFQIYARRSLAWESDRTPQVGRGGRCSMEFLRLLLSTAVAHKRELKWTREEHRTSFGSERQECASGNGDAAATLVKRLLSIGSKDVAAVVYFSTTGDCQSYIAHATAGEWSARLVSKLSSNLEIERLGRDSRYISPNGDWDFRTFNIENSYLIPVIFAERFLGTVWLGWRPGVSLEPRLRKHLEMEVRTTAPAICSDHRIREARSENARHREILLGISHDLRAPGNSALYAISGALSATDPSSLQRRFLLAANAAIRDQLDMLSTFMDFERHSRSCLDPNRERIVLATMLESSVQRTREWAESARIALRVECPPAIAVLADQIQATRIVENLLSNAIKYSKAAEVHIVVQSMKEHVLIEVRDNGVGIPPDEQEQLFKEFSRLSGSAGTSGLGLGLSLCKVLAELNGGSIRYQPNEPNGSNFILRLETAAEDSTMVKNTVNRLNVLIVEDDVFARKSHERALDGICNAEVAADVTDAEQKLSGDRIDVLLTDYHLAGSTAETLLHLAKKFGIGIVVVTGSSNSDLRHYLFTAFGAISITKPATRLELRAALQKVFRERDQGPNILRQSVRLG
jgi:signal transduction histidine kinase